MVNYAENSNNVIKTGYGNGTEVSGTEYFTAQYHQFSDGSNYAVSQGSRNPTAATTNYSFYAKSKRNAAFTGWYGISVSIPDSGRPKVTSNVTPTLDSNNNELVTTSWINSKFQVVSALPQNPDSNVFYFVKA